MNFKDAIKKRRSVYAIQNTIPVSDEDLLQFVEETATWVPDAFNMQSQRVLVLLGDQHIKFWDMLNEYFDNKINPEKLAGFKGGHGTLLLFWDKNVVEHMQESFPDYKDNFPLWAEQANGMLQFALWTGLATQDIGASLQHYNPCFDQKMREAFDIPEHWMPSAQMPFGEAKAFPDAPDKQDIKHRVIVKK